VQGKEGGGFGGGKEINEGDFVGDSRYRVRVGEYGLILERPGQKTYKDSLRKKGFKKGGLKKAGKRDLLGSLG